MGFEEARSHSGSRQQRLQHWQMRRWWQQLPSSRFWRRQGGQARHVGPDFSVDAPRHRAEPAQGGAHELLSTIAERWGTAYSLDNLQEVAVTESDDGDAFVFVASDVVNTGACGSTCRDARSRIRPRVWGRH